MSCGCGGDAQKTSRNPTNARRGYAQPRNHRSADPMVKCYDTDSFVPGDGCSFDIAPAKTCIPTMIKIAGSIGYSDSQNNISGFSPSTGRTRQVISGDAGPTYDTNFSGDENNLDAVYSGILVYWSGNLLTNVPMNINCRLSYAPQTRLAVDDPLSVNQFSFTPRSRDGAILLLPWVESELYGLTHNPMVLRGNLTDGVTNLAVAKPIELRTTAVPGWNITAQLLGYDSIYTLGMLKGIARNSRLVQVPGSFSDGNQAVPMKMDPDTRGRSGAKSRSRVSRSNYAHVVARLR